MAPSSVSPPSLNEAVQQSSDSWQADLQSLFDSAKDRFADVVWELLGQEDAAADAFEEVWGHKAIVYARAPPSFQARYFSFRPAPPASPMPYYSPNGQSSLSLNGDIMSYSPARSPSPYGNGTVRTQSPVPSTAPGQILRLTTTIASALFSNELEYLYTGKGFGEAFEFLFETNEGRPEGDAEEQRVDKLRKDFVFMWRSRLYSDVRLNITGSFQSATIPDGEESSAQFSSHRFVLVSRSPYFRTQLLGNFAPPVAEPGQPLILNLPSPPFTPASLHFVLGYLYTGTLAFSHRTFDLDSAFHIMRSATYLTLTCLYNETQARVVQDMMHGLFHAFLDFEAYETVTGGRWGAGGCKCKTCTRRAPRILEFAVADDVKNIYLERGARRAIVGHFGEGWCTSEFASLPQKTRDGLIKGISKRAVVFNILPLIIAGYRGLSKLDSITNANEAWIDISRQSILTSLKHIAEALCSHPFEVFEEPDWIAILERDGASFEDVELVEWVMSSIRMGLSEKNAGLIYQALVSSILIRPHPTELGDTMLSAQSRVRAHVEKCREDVLRWLRRRWMGVRQDAGFNEVDSWALKEISHEIEVPVDELYNHSPPPPPLNGATRSSARSAPRVSTSRNLGNDDASSVSSLRASVLSKRLTQSTLSSSVRERVNSSAGSVRSSASSVRTTDTAGSTSTAKRSDKSNLTRNTVNDAVIPTFLSRGAPASIASSQRAARTPAQSLKSLKSPSVVSLTRPRTSSAKSVSTVDTTATPRNSTIGTIPSVARSASSATSKSDATSNFRSAKSEVSGPTLSIPRTRRTSTASAASNASARSATAQTLDQTPRARRPSNASAVSARSNALPAARKVSPNTKAASAITPRPKSIASVRSVASKASVQTAKGRSTSGAPPPVPEKDVPMSNATKPPMLRPNVKGKGKENPTVDEIKRLSRASESDGSTIKGSPITRKTSNDTIKDLNAAIPPPIQAQTVAPIHSNGNHTSPPQSGPRGATLNVGIPCIVTSKRSRFRAFARYIGEVEGENGPWVGVEVPVNDSWGNDKLGGRQWNDGSWGGVRYFNINPGSEYDEADERVNRRRRFDNISALLHQDSKGTKREGEQLSLDRAKRMRSASPASDMSITDTRGLFVRPQQILYVVDAVGMEL